MFTVPNESLPSVEVNGTTYRLFNRSAIDPATVMDPAVNPYKYVESGIQLLNTETQSQYAKGALACYQTLTGEHPDLALLAAMAMMENGYQDWPTNPNNHVPGRKEKGSDNFGTGALDMWRLLVDKARDVRAVIAAQ
jgi:hypothetical protein